ncbi:MAG: hypothetical protein ABJB95_01670 [Gemmatimonadales bacterium]
MRMSIQARIWRRSIPGAWKQTQLLQPAKLASCVAIAALNILWHGHGIFRLAPPVVRFVAVGIACYIVTTLAEFLWLMYTGPKFTGFESPTAAKGTPRPDAVDPLVEVLSELAPAELRDEALQLAEEMKTFEASADREFVKTLAPAQPLQAASEEELEEAFDIQSAELMENNLQRGRAFKERFYRPARAFRDELRRRLGINNLNSEPRIPALDQAVLTGAKPIAQAADYLAGLARRLK